MTDGRTNIVPRGGRVKNVTDVLFWPVLIRWTGRQVDMWIVGQVDRWTGGQVDRWTGRQVDRWTCD